MHKYVYTVHTKMTFFTLFVCLIVPAIRGAAGPILVGLSLADTWCNKE